MPREQSLIYRLSALTGTVAAAGAIYAAAPSVYSRVLEQDALKAAELQNTFDAPFFWLVLITAAAASLALVTRPK